MVAIALAQPTTSSNSNTVAHITTMLTHIALFLLIQLHSRNTSENRCKCCMLIDRIFLCITAHMYTSFAIGQLVQHIFVMVTESSQPQSTLSSKSFCKYCLHSQALYFRSVSLICTKVQVNLYPKALLSR